jgi:hypothetical protein
VEPSRRRTNVIPSGADAMFDVSRVAETSIPKLVEYLSYAALEVAAAH